jgi:aspartyl-tRNA(Asn)/glutamyl-tRNA(Gln) amidotransferase subunit B
MESNTRSRARLKFIRAAESSNRKPSASTKRQARRIHSAARKRRTTIGTSPSLTCRRSCWIRIGSSRFIADLNLTPSEARFLTSERSLADYFERVVAKSRSPAKTVHSWIAGEFMRYVNDSGMDVKNITLPPESFAQLIDMVTDKTIGGNAGKTVLAELLKNGGDPAQIVKEKGLAQVSDESFIQEAVMKVLNDNSSEVEKYLAGKDTLLQWFVGQVARATKGKADPNVTKELLVKELEERRK